jgi:hypothetical protein
VRPACSLPRGGQDEQRLSSHAAKDPAASGGEDPAAGTGEDADKVAVAVLMRRPLLPLISGGGMGMLPWL